MNTIKESHFVGSSNKPPYILAEAEILDMLDKFDSSGATVITTEDTSPEEKEF